MEFQNANSLGTLVGGYRGLVGGYRGLVEVLCMYVMYY